MQRNDLEALRVHNTRRAHLLYRVLFFFISATSQPELNLQTNYPLGGDVRNESLPMQKTRYRHNKKKRLLE